MSECKTVKINLGDLVADLMFHTSVGKAEDVNSIKSRFETLFSEQSSKTRGAILKYLLSNKVVLTEPTLLNYFSNIKVYHG
jgi:hypothetical protein